MFMQSDTSFERIELNSSTCNSNQQQTDLSCCFLYTKNKSSLLQVHLFNSIFSKEYLSSRDVLARQCFFQNNRIKWICLHRTCLTCHLVAFCVAWQVNCKQIDLIRMFRNNAAPNNVMFMSYAIHFFRKNRIKWICLQ